MSTANSKIESSPVGRRTIFPGSQPVAIGKLPADVDTVCRYPGCRVVTVELPLKPLEGEAQFAPGMIGRVVNIRLDEHQRTALYKIRQAMNDAHLRLKSGAHVDTYADVVKWILEQAI